MSRALIECRTCGNRWEYSGLHRFTAFCPTCSAKNRLAHHAVDVHRVFGYGDTKQNQQAAETALQTAADRDHPADTPTPTPGD